jgi:hypothetical protein
MREYWFRLEVINMEYYGAYDCFWEWKHGNRQWYPW